MASCAVSKLVLRVALGLGPCAFALCAVPSVSHAEPSKGSATASTTAEPSEADQRAARSLYNEGRAAYDRGDYEAAVQAFLAAQERAPAPRLLFNVAQALRLAKRCPEAADYYQRVRQSGMTLPADFEALVREVTDCAAKEKERTQSQSAAPAAATKTEPTPAAPTSTTAPSAEPLPQAELPSPVVERSEAKASDDARMWGYVASGLGLVGVGVGAVTGVLAIDSKNTLDDPELCNARTCSAEGVEEEKRGKTYATVSTAAFSMGLVGLGVGAYFLFFHSNEKKEEARGAHFDVVRLDGGLQVTVGASL